MYDAGAAPRGWYSRGLPITIAHIDTALDWRGGQQSLLTLARGLRERGHEQTIVCPAESALAREARAIGLTVAGRPARDAQIVHAHSGKAHNLAVRSTLLAGVRRIVTRHVAFEPRHPLVHRLKYTRTCDAIVAVSESVQRVLVSAGVPPAMTTVIYTGIDLPAFPAPRARSGNFLVGHMGAFTHEKGQDLLIEAARSLPEIRFILAGDGPLLEKLRAGAPTNVEFPGFLPDRTAFFQSLDLFAMPSRSEAWGLAALEAMAHGVPVIAADIGGLAELVPWRVPPNDTAALTHAIRQAASAPSDERSREARAIAERYSIARMAEQTEALYQRVLGGC